MNKTCKRCGCVLTDDNWYPSYQKTSHYLCKHCEKERMRVWRKENQDRSCYYASKYRYRNGGLSMSDNKRCSAYLGIRVAERVLKHVFKDVNMMPRNNIGFDFSCNKGKKVDVKSSCLRRTNGKLFDRWEFGINYNTVADFFLCIAFDDREKLNPLHIWLLPSEDFYKNSVASIGVSTLQKWSDYELDINKVVNCCDFMRDVK